MISLVPDWLVGTWNRDYIRRAKQAGEELGLPDSSIKVMYIQTPWAFVDVRKSTNNNSDGNMGFAGFTSVAVEKGVSPLVKWHACMDMEKPVPTAPRDFWKAALENTPPHTEDEGYFECLEKNALYRERDPDGTLEEQWRKAPSPSKDCIAALHKDGNALVVVCGHYFGFAMQTLKETMFCAGTTTNDWTIVMSSTHPQKEQTQLVLPDKMDDYEVLAGSTLDLEILSPCFSK